MNNTQLRYVLLVFLFIIFITQFFISHELIHGEIAKNHGCIDIDYGVNYDGAYTQCLNYSSRTNEVKLQERYLHSLNELIGYYIISIIGLVFTSILFYMLTKDLRGKNDI